MEEQGHTAYSLAAAAGVSAESIYRWKDTTVRPHVGNAIAVATVLNAPQLLAAWGYEYAAKQLQGPKTEDADIANGWRLDTLIDELQETNKLLRRIDNRLANPKEQG